MWLWYLVSNVTTANFVLNDLDLNFEGHTFETFMSWKRWVLHKKKRNTMQKLIFVIDWCYCECECCTPWPWPSFSGSTIFLLCILIKKIAHAADVPGRFALTCAATAVELLLFFLVWWQIYFRCEIKNKQMADSDLCSVESGLVGFSVYKGNYFFFTLWLPSAGDPAKNLL